MSIGEWIILGTLLLSNFLMVRRIREQTAGMTSDFRITAANLTAINASVEATLEKCLDVSRSENPWSERKEWCPYEDGSFDNNTETLLRAVLDIRNDLREQTNLMDDFLKFKGMTRE